MVKHRSPKPTTGVRFPQPVPNKMNSQPRNLFRDLAIIGLSIVLAVLLAKTGALESFLVKTQQSRIIGSFIAGIFFVSVFTVVPASVVLAELAQHNSIWLVALFGGLGALAGDFLIFLFVKDSLSKDLMYLAKKSRFLKRITSVFRLKFLRWLTPLAGALIVASPLPDELGLMLMGFSKMKSTVFIPLSLALNFLGILTVGWLVRNLV